MSYVDPDYKTKKAFKEALKAGIEHRTYNPSGMFPVPANGRDVVEVPHYPKPHSWNVRVLVVDGVVEKILG